MSRRFQSFTEFWPFYVAEHSRKGTRFFHFLGTSLLFLFLARGIILHSMLYLIYAVAGAYVLAWFSHFVIEKNRPATFRYPLFSLMGDFKMYALILFGRMNREIERLKIRSA
jgi:hypothetical protein